MNQYGERITWRHNVGVLPFIVPFLLVFSLYIAWPLVYSFYLSMHRSTIYSDFYNVFSTMKFVGLDNYRVVMSNPDFWFSIGLTFVYATLTIVPGMAFSLALALFLNKKTRSFAAMRSGFFLPNVFDVYVVGVIWLLIYNPQGGLIVVTLKSLGLDNVLKDGLLANPYLTLPSIAFAMILKNAGFGMILFMTSLNNINSSIFEAADVDGCNGLQKLRHITLPLLKPTIIFLVVTGVVGSLNTFAEIYAMADNGGPSGQVGEYTVRAASISGFVLYRYFADSMYGEAAAMSFLLLVVALVISVVNAKFLTSKD